MLSCSVDHAISTISKPGYLISQLKPFLIIGIKHCFSCINVCQVPREMLKTEAEGREASVFNISLGTWQTLMYWKTMFDRCYCIISRKCSVTFAKNVALYFVNV